MKPQTPAPKKAITGVPSVHRKAAVFGWSRRPFQAMVKANTTMAKNGATSSVEKIEPIHCQ